MTSLVTASNVSKRFGNVHAVDDVSFEIEKGKIMGLFGPNGAGKTTLLNLLTGVLKPDEGEVLVVYFGYTSCPDVCPTTLADLRKALADLDDEAAGG